MTSFTIEEATISGIHRAVRQGHLTFVELMQSYLDRIAAFDKASGLNAVVVVNPKALERAKQLDGDFKRTGKLAALTGIPVVVKDNYWTSGLQTTAGSVALKGFEPPDDAFMVRRVVEAGGIILCKSNMAEWAMHWGHSMSSIQGETRNPYDLERTTSGSSGGTAAAVAANLGAVGLGSDTGNSIRGPSSHCALVGLRPTIGATSRHGIIPLWERNDVGGPMCRTVEDTAKVFSVIAGFDEADPITAHGRKALLPDYTECLHKSLHGVTVGVVGEFTDYDHDFKFLHHVQAAIADLKRLGATVVNPIIVARYIKKGDDFDTVEKGNQQELKEEGFFYFQEGEFDSFFEAQCKAWAGINTGFKHDINAHFQSLGELAPFQDIADIFAAGLYEARSRHLHNSSHYVDDPPDAGSPLDAFTDPERCAFRKAIIEAMDASKLDVLVFPTWNEAPLKVGSELTTINSGNNNSWVPVAGLPAITVPMGFAGAKKNLPLGLQIVGRPFAEDALFHVAYAYEQGTLHRKPPEGFSGDRPPSELSCPVIPARCVAEEEERIIQIERSGKLNQQSLHRHSLVKEREILHACSVHGPACLQICTNFHCTECDWAVCTVCLSEHVGQL